MAINKLTPVHTNEHTKAMFVQETTGFDWDHGNRDKCQKHGVSVDALESAFHEIMTIFPDPAHSQGEERFIAIGKTDEGRNVFVAFTLRYHGGEAFIRPISARYMHQKEVDYYEKAIAKTDDR
jgi:uncharacterized DUF497 family protein